MTCKKTCHNAEMKHHIAISEHMLYLFRGVKGEGCTGAVRKSKKAESLELKILALL